MRSSTSFATRLSIRLIIFISILLLVSMTLLGLYSVNKIKEQAISNVEALMNITVSDIESVIGEVEATIDNMDWVVDSHIDEEHNLYEITRQLVQMSPVIIGSAIAFEPGYYQGKDYFSPYSSQDSTGEVTSMQLGSKDYDYPAIEWYLVPKLLEKPYWSEPYYFSPIQCEMSTYARPLVDENGEFYGVLTADISLKWLSDKVASIKPYEDSYAFLIGRNGSYISHIRPERIGTETIFSIAAQEGVQEYYDLGKKMLAGESGLMKFKNEGVSSFVVYAPLSNGWSIGVVCSYMDVFSSLHKTNVIIIHVIMAALLALFIVCFKTVKKMTIPIVEFTTSAMTIAKGNFNATIPEVKSKDELLKLRNSLDYMQKSINSYISELKTTTSANERFESELNIARAIQMNMLPTDFPVNREKSSLYAIVQPAKEVGGDLYDFCVRDGKLFFAVGDVSGKGVPAALVMAITRAAFRFMCGLGIPMSEIMQRVNNSISDGNTLTLFVTMFAGCLDLETGELEYCNAGHNPIIIVDPDGKARYLKAETNLVVGVISGFDYKEERLKLEHGSRLLLYTDGVTEAERTDKSQYGEEALLQWADGRDTTESTKQYVIDLLAEVKKFTGENEQNDDITIMSIKYK